ncbi:hypothetical protein V3C99_002984 [Haemonchus contortus]
MAANNIPPSGREGSSRRYSFFWFKHGCCVPTTSAIWMLLVLFLFAIMMMIFCCLSTAFVRWVYRRQLRKKSDSLRRRFRSEEEKRRDNEMRLKELALRPIHTTQIRGSPDLFHAEFVEEPKPVVPGSREDVTQKNPPVSHPRSREFTEPIGLFTGNTVYSTSTLPPTGPSGDMADTTYFRLPGTVPTDRTKEEVAMEPADVAATVHTIAKEGKLDETRQQAPFSGVVIIKKKPSETTSEVPTSQTGGTSGTTGTTTPYQALRRKLRASGDDETSSTEHETPKEKPPVLQKKEEPPRSKPYFPYWTAQKFSASKVEPNVSPSGKIRGSKVTTSEKSFWMPTGAGPATRSVPTTSAASSQDPSQQGMKPSEADTSRSRPRDVYQLRRELERLRTNEISAGMKSILDDAKRKREKAERPQPQNLPSDRRPPSSQKDDVKSPASSDMKTPSYRGVSGRTSEKR